MAVKLPGANPLISGPLSKGRSVIPPLPKPPAQYNPSQQAAGYTRRLKEGLGIDVEKELDDRNFIGRALNLQKDQNFLLDALEVVSRPRHALFGGLEAIASGDDPLLAMQRGLSGEELNRFKDVLIAAGAESNVGTNIAGFIGDVLLDPVNIPLFAIKAPLAAAKGVLTVKKAGVIAKSGANAGRVIAAANAKGTGLKNIIKNSDDILRITKEGIAGKKTLSKAVGKGSAITDDVIKTAQEAIAKYNNLDDLVKTVLAGETYAKRVSALGLAGKGIKKGFGATLNFTDSSVGKMLRNIDEFNGIRFNNPNIKNLKDFGAMDPLPEGIKQSWLQNYYDVKNTVLSTFDYAKVIPERVLRTISEKTSKYDVSKANLTKKYVEVKARVDKSWEILQGVTDDAGNLLFQSKDELEALLQRAIEYKFRYGPEALKTLGELTVDEVLSNAGHRLGQKAFDTLNEIAQRSNLGDLTQGTIGQGVIKQISSDGTATYLLNDDLRNKMMQAIGTADKTVLNTSLARTSYYDKEMIDFLEKILKNKDFSALMTDTAKDLETFQFALTEFQGQAKIEGYTEAGYMRHLYNQDFNVLKTKEARSILSGEGITDQLKGVLPGADDLTLNIGNVQAVAERQFKMSAYEANQIMGDFIRTKLDDVGLSPEARALLQSVEGKDLFIESVTASAADWIKEIPRLVKEASLIDEILVKASVTINPAGTSTINPVSDVMIINYTGATLSRSSGYLPYSHKKLITQLEKLTKVVDSNEMTNLLEYLKTLPTGGEAAIDKNVLQMLSFMSDSKGPGPLIGFVEGANNLFKKTKLLSPGFQMRNIIGNSTNMYLAGVPMTQIPFVSRRAHNIFNQAPAISKKVLEGGKQSLTAKEKVIFDYFERFVNAGFLYTAEPLYDITAATLSFGAKEGGSKLDPRAIAEMIVNMNNHANQYMDARFRMGLMLYADTNPEMLGRLGVDTAEAAVRRGLFDPKSISPNERQVIKRIIPFYTWAKKNLAWQMKNILDNPERYQRLVTGIDAAWDINGIDWRDIEQYKRENFWIPMPGLSDGNKYTAIRLNLPIRSLTDFAASPLKNIIGVSSPLVRVPFELATGSQIYTQRPIQDFEGQKGFNFDFLTRRQEYLLSQTGLDVPLRTVQGIAQGFQSLGPSQEFSLGQSVPSAFAEGSVERAQRSKEYDKLAQVRDLYSYYRQRSGSIPTIAEIENINKQSQLLKQRMNRLKLK